MRRFHPTNPLADPLRRSLYRAPFSRGGGVNPTLPQFITVWDTETVGGGTSASNQISLPLVSGGSYNFGVDWGDGNTDQITAYDQAEVTHTYNTGGVYTVTIYANPGEIHGWRFANAGDAIKLEDISQWGSLSFTNETEAFAGCINMTCTATDKPDVSAVTSFYRFFYNCRLFNGVVANWVTSSATDINSMFQLAFVFDQPVDTWDTSSVINMNRVFEDARVFNQPLNSWDVANVTTTVSMFSNARLFNQSILSWDTSKVTSMAGMFVSAMVFNQPVNHFVVDKVSSFNSMFVGAVAFNQPIDQWVFGNLFIGCITMFANCTSFNQDMGDFDMIKVDNPRSFLYNSGIDTTNYSLSLIDWATQGAVNKDVREIPATYNASAAAAHAQLISDGWTLTDLGPE